MVELHEARSDRDQPRDDGADRSPQVLDLEARLIDRARRGDIQAWSRLYQEHFDRVFRHLHHLTGDRDLAEDLVQETFARAMVSIATFRGESRLSTWLGGIAINIVRGHWRRQKTAANANINLRAIHEIAPPSGPAPEEATLRRTRAEVLYAILRELPESLREVFVLRELAGSPRVMSTSARAGPEPASAPSSSASAGSTQRGASDGRQDDPRPRARSLHRRGRSPARHARHRRAGATRLR
ncbi:MAG: sigma-70 family RNA polymerase sigma factor [Myxococcales bacterium]|nr:sigma-70 family RNA polymerase sigma factor [Myxococcales bacterium]